MIPDGFDFRSPDYPPIWQTRVERLKRIRERGFDLAALKAFYKDHPAEFISDFGCTFDPRNAEVGLATTVPFLLFPKQVELINWLRNRWQKREDGLVEKSRDMGASWLCVAFAVWMWLFYPGVVAGFGSRKEEYVDKAGDPKSLFWKARQFISLLPPEFTPVGYSEKTHAPNMRILNPENGSVIVGEAGDNIGRGNRASIYFVDESAFLERPELIDAALSQTSNCQIHVSSANGSGNPFYRKRHSGRFPVFTFHWRDDPRKDDAWYKKQTERLDPIVVAQEIDIDYNASVSDAFIPGADITAAQGNRPADVEVIGQWRIGVDAAHYGDDESVIHCRRGRLNLKQMIRRQVDGPTLAAVVAEQAEILSQTAPLEAIVIELDGPGVSCYDALRQTKWAPFVVGVHTGARRSDNKNYNLKAWAWRLARDYLADGPVCMDADPEIKSQLGAVKYRYKDGLLLMQDKKEYKKEFGKSPDRADAFVLTFAVPEKAPKQERARRAAGGWMG